MNIRYIQSNIKKIPQDNLVKFLYDIILQEISNVKNYQNNVTYHKGDRVYLQENNKHQIFQCIVDNSSSTFVDDEWIYIMEVFEGSVDIFQNFMIREETHIIDNSSIYGVHTNLNITSANTTLAVYCGKKRYAIGFDYNIEGNYISFNKALNVGDRIILETRELIGRTSTIGVILYDLNKNPYNVYINYNGIIGIEPYDTNKPTDAKYGELVTGDRTYTLLVDGGSKPYELKAYRKIETYITGTTGKLFKLEVENDKLNLIQTDRGDCYSDTQVILGLDKKFYTLDNINDKIIATEYKGDSLDIRNFDMGVKVITNEFKNRLVCIDNGKIKLLPYIDNGGYTYINLRDIDTGEVNRISIDNDDFVIEKGLATDGYSGTRILDYFYFFDENWDYNKLFIKDGELMFDSCNLEIVPDSRGINIMKKDGELIKIIFDNTSGDIYDGKYLNLDNLGTFESPIEGFVVKINNVNKLVTVNKSTDGFEIVNTNLPFRTNHHYIMSKDNRLYKLEITNNEVSFIEKNKNDYNIDMITIGAFIKSNEMIVRFDIDNGKCIFNPISTFVHRIKSLNGESYVVDVHGEPYQEVLGFMNMNDVDFGTENIGSGYMYLKDENDNAYVVDIDENGNMNFINNLPLDDIDYNITSLIESSQGWYNIKIVDKNIVLEKLFDNMYENILSYGNMVKKVFNMQGNNGKWYSLSANGLGEIVVNELDKDVNVTGLLLRSDDGYNYGLGVINNNFVTYRSYVTNPNVTTELIVKDTNNNNIHSLFMSGDRLCSRLTGNANYNTHLIMYDAYRNKFKIEIKDNRLVVSSL